jgi:arylsulfatase
VSPRAILLAVTLLGCGNGAPWEHRVSPVDARVLPPAAPPAPGPVDLTQGSGSRAWRLLDHLDEATYELAPGGNSPVSDGRFELSGAWSEAPSFGRSKSWARPLPFRCDQPRPNWPPRGAVLRRGDVAIPFGGTGAPAAGPSWYVERGQLRLLSEEDPSSWTEPLLLVVGELAAEAKAREFASSGKSAADFVRGTMERREGDSTITQPALLLPAPSSATWRLTLPPGAELRFTSMLLADPVTGETIGDGARIAISVDGEEAWSGGVSATGARSNERVDLGDWEGKTVTLAIATRPGTSPAGDWVALGAPYLRATPERPPRRIVQVGIDTLRRDALGLHGGRAGISESLDAWGRQSVVFTRAYAPAPRTRPSFRTALSGAWPYESVATGTIAESLSREGFATAGFTANVHLVPRFGFDRGSDTWQFENGARAEEQVERALTWLREHQDEDAYVFLHLMDPHTYYNAPEEWRRRFETGPRPPGIPGKFNRWQIIQLMERRKLEDGGKAWIRSAYEAEVAYVAHEAARFLAAVEDLPGRTLSVLHTDHGEEFWDHGGYEHNHSLYDELVRAVLWIRPPGGWAGEARVDAPTSLADIVPTLLDLVGVSRERWPAVGGTSLRPFIDAGTSADAAALTSMLYARPLQLGYLLFDRERWGVVAAEHKYILHTASGREELYDLAADPGEQRDLAGGDLDLEPYRRAMETAFQWPVRSGFRVRLGHEPDTTVLEFDQPIEGAGVIDPAAGERTRTNREWEQGGTPAPAEVGSVEVSPDRRTVRFVPGPAAAGQVIYVTCAGSCPTGWAEARGKRGRIGVAGPPLAPTGLRVEPGTLVTPLSADADFPTGSATKEQVEMLKALGYIDDRD